MTETSVQLAKLEHALVEAGGLLQGLPEHDVRNRLDQLKLKSYVLLCHAAIENYLEQVSISVLHQSMEAFGADGLMRDPLLSACSYYKIDISQVVSTRNGGDQLQEILLSLCRSAIAQHRLSLDGVNGVKTKDQDAILLPIGIKLFDFDRVLSQNLNSFGETRGEFAHSFGFRTIPPRIGQERKVWNLFRLLLSLDNFLCDRHKMSFTLG